MNLLPIFTKPKTLLFFFKSKCPEVFTAGFVTSILNIARTAGVYELSIGLSPYSTYYNWQVYTGDSKMIGFGEFSGELCKWLMETENEASNATKTKEVRKFLRLGCLILSEETIENLIRQIYQVR